MSLTQEQIYILLHRQFKITKNATQAAKNINDLVNRKVVSNRKAQRVFKQLREGRQTFRRKHGQGRRVTVNRRALLKRFRSNPAISTVELSKNICSISTAKRWLKKRGLRWKKANEVPHSLTVAQKNKRVDTCLNLLVLHRRGRFLRNIITCYESWIFFDNSYRGNQWLSPNQLGVPVPRRPLHGKKLMLSVFWSMRGPVYWELLPPNVSINSNLYCTQLTNVNNAIRVLRGNESWEGPGSKFQIRGGGPKCGWLLFCLKNRIYVFRTWNPKIAPSLAFSN
ncbi:HTH_48 domain-containing protein [Meloidogyne graminicola]|uniref:HTH_48 domain-containing protein n=1 Tax=Meloidogyne graminicola TaxID=189291 RepID=A0A8S9ZSV4_9BILA|nr:HTH_48 domain-containing protein [Meloidogyne graminicola]